jgi:hypothetical protein
MSTILTALGTILVTFIIISPFFWLRFLYRKNRKLYVFYGALATVAIFLVNIIYIESLLLNYFAKINTDLYYFYYDINDWTFFVFLFLTLLGPFILTKIIYNKFTFKLFFISLGFSFIIVLIHFLVLALYIAPKAFESLNKNL